MKLVVASDGRLLVTDRHGDLSASVPSTGTLAPGIHELLYDRTTSCRPSFVAGAMVAAERLEYEGRKGNTAPIVWCQQDPSLYPPAAMAVLGVSPSRLYIVAPHRDVDVAWATAECLRCPGIGAVVASVPSRLSRVEVRRLQLAAERGRTLGVLLRPAGPGDDVYAAATRWFVSPLSGDPTTQRWRVELIHGHGRHAFQSFVLERRHGAAVPAILSIGEQRLAAGHRASVAVRPPHSMADRPSPASCEAAVG